MNPSSAVLNPITEVPINSIYPSPDNKIYRPVDPNDPEIIALAESIEKHGLMEAIVMTLDD